MRGVNLLEDACAISIMCAIFQNNRRGLVRCEICLNIYYTHFALSQNVISENLNILKELNNRCYINFTVMIILRYVFIAQ